MSFDCVIPMLGMDVSAYQGVIDWQSVRACAIDFVMLRASYGWGNPDRQTDAFFHRNAYDAAKAGLWMGAYHSSQATCEEQAHREASCFLQVIDGYAFGFPVAIDITDKALEYLGRRWWLIAAAWCDDVRRAGYLPMIRAGRDTLIRRLPEDIHENTQLWAAQPLLPTDKSEDIGIVRYSMAGRVDGVQGAVGLNRAYTIYPQMIGSGGYNGFGQPPVQTASVESPMENAMKMVGTLSDVVALKNLLTKLETMSPPEDCDKAVQEEVVEEACVHTKKRSRPFFHKKHKPL